MVKAMNIIKMAMLNMKENFLMINMKEMENTILKMEIIMKEIGKMVK